MNQEVSRLQTPSKEKARQMRGRPIQIKPEDRIELVLEATMSLLSKKALHTVTMAKVAQVTGMSKRTIYQMFDSRDALLSATIARVIQRIYPPLPPEADGKPLAQRLELILKGTDNNQFGPARLELLRAILSSAHQFPELAKRTHREGFVKLTTLVRAELEVALKNKEISLAEDALSDAAKILVDMAKDSVLKFLLDPDQSKPDAAAQAARLRLAIYIFLNGVRSQN